MKRSARVLGVCIPIVAIAAFAANGGLRSTPVRGVAHDSRIVINLAERRLKVLRGGEVAGEYEIAVGKPETPTPTGEFRISVKQLHPGPATGVLGARWMEFYRVDHLRRYPSPLRDSRDERAPKNWGRGIAWLHPA
jgi:hypothetical protein